VSDTDTETQPASTYHLDRASARTDAERVDHWEHWWLKFGEPYQAAVIANGDTPWTTDLDERAELFARRYSRPQAPKGLSIPSIWGGTHGRAAV
jgi:hypothetical protein